MSQPCMDMQAEQDLTTLHVCMSVLAPYVVVPLKSVQLLQSFLSLIVYLHLLHAVSQSSASGDSNILRSLKSQAKQPTLVQLFNL